MSLSVPCSRQQRPVWLESEDHHDIWRHFTKFGVNRYNTLQWSVHSQQSPHHCTVATTNTNQKLKLIIAVLVSALVLLFTQKKSLTHNVCFQCLHADNSRKSVGIIPIGPLHSANRSHYVNVCTFHTTHSFSVLTYEQYAFCIPGFDNISCVYVHFHRVYV